MGQPFYLDVIYGTLFTFLSRKFHAKNEFFYVRSVHTHIRHLLDSGSGLAGLLGIVVFIMVMIMMVVERSLVVQWLPFNWSDLSTFPTRSEMRILHLKCYVELSFTKLAILILILSVCRIINAI